MMHVKQTARVRNFGGAGGGGDTGAGGDGDWW